MMRIALLFLVSICFSVLADCQVVIHNYQELRGYADNASPTARQANIQSEVASEDVDIQASGLHPRVKAFATGDYYPVIPTQVIPAEVLGGTPGTYLKAQFGLPYVLSTGVELSIPIINLEKWAQLSRSKAQRRQAQWSARVAAENLHLQLLQHYYQVLAAAEVLKLNNDNLRTTNELMRVMEERNKVGILNPSDYNRSKNLLLDVQNTAVNYDRLLKQAYNGLKALAGISSSTTLEIRDSLSSFHWPLLDSGGDVKSRAAWNEVAAKVEVSERALKESRAGALPKLDLNGRYAYNLQTELKGPASEVTFNIASLGLRLDLPLYQGNFYRAQRNKSSLLLESAKMEQERIKAQLEEQHEGWLIAYHAAYRRNALLKHKIAITSDNLRIANLNMQAGLMEFDEYNNIFIEYNRARMDQIQNLADGVLYYLLCTQSF